MQYRRATIAGGSFFFTLVTDDRKRLFTNEPTVDLLRQAFRHVKRERPFRIEAMVILPDHLHSIWTLPPSDQDFSTRWRLVKTWFTKHYQGPWRLSHAEKAGQSPWQHRFWEHALRDETDFKQHVEYIHYNPVKHGYVDSPSEWPYSSFHRYVRRGIYPPDWGTGKIDFDGVGRE